ncbi:hypothetical protein GCM10023347_05080 [Streptomyces chumphonensis]|uniref:Uncharacterized protein n=1 Tax=Streptomyces chumphonensis TaxID=1214925 RepID=A0A927F2S2_9ACTN|nr:MULTISPECIES: hypothetical protein [Streptomyces]MBD3933139.1 hypothetical protein [Streptomyces chumphonensis]MBW1599754.1 hypothetical protein [Streptomyces sp. JJ38]
MRLRIRRITWPRRAIVLADTPRPDCRDCGGEGGNAYDYGEPFTGEYAGTDWEPCPCWHEDRRWVLIPLPRRRPRPTSRSGYCDEPPF